MELPFIQKHILPSLLIQAIKSSFFPTQMSLRIKIEMKEANSWCLTNPQGVPGNFLGFLPQQHKVNMVFVKRKTLVELSQAK